MDHHDHVNLLRGGISRPEGVWADFGSGSGAFTFALAELIQTTGMIFSIDTDRSALRHQEASMKDRFSKANVQYIHADYTRKIILPPLDGIIAANTLHFHFEKYPILNLFLGYLKSSGRMILVEYNVDRGNMWVPYPFSYPEWVKIAKRSGFRETCLLARRPSHFLKEIYSALSIK